MSTKGANLKKDVSDSAKQCQKIEIVYSRSVVTSGHKRFSERCGLTGFPLQLTHAIDQRDVLKLPFSHRILHIIITAPRPLTRLFLSTYKYNMEKRE